MDALDLYDVCIVVLVILLFKIEPSAHQIPPSPLKKRITNK